MRGQLVFEFMVAVVVFFGIVFYAISYLNGTVSGYSRDFSSESMQSKTSQIGEMLVLNKGKWSGGEPDIIGLAEEWPVLNRTKILWFNTSCNRNLGYEDFANKVGLNPKYRMKIMINETQASGAVLVMADCVWGWTVTGNVTRAETKRYALVPDTADVMNVVSVYVCVWSTGM